MYEYLYGILIRAANEPPCVTNSKHVVTVGVTVTVTVTVVVIVVVIMDLTPSKQIGACVAWHRRISYSSLSLAVSKYTVTISIDRSTLMIARREVVHIFQFKHGYIYLYIHVKPLRWCLEQTCKSVSNGFLSTYLTCL